MTKSRIRCAIYTRKSSDEGLEQGFNSLDAQHEACAAYVASQKHEGWRLVRDRFDDGGVSGGTLERPALTLLLSEIDAGRIAMVVVYKINRLTRSLADFARLVERLDAAGCSFVSVTQAFNTATSMGSHSTYFSPLPSSSAGSLPNAFETRSLPRRSWGFGWAACRRWATIPILIPTHASW